MCVRGFTLGGRLEVVHKSKSVVNLMLLVNVVLGGAGVKGVVKVMLASIFLGTLCGKRQICVHWMVWNCTSA